MIGGIDIRLKTRAGANSIEVAVRAIRQLWPHAVFENGQTGERYGQFGSIPFGEIEEIFVYRDNDTAEKWEAEGAIPELFNTMIHIIHDEGFLTIVVDEQNAETSSLIEAIQSAIESAGSRATASMP